MYKMIFSFSDSSPGYPNTAEYSIALVQPTLHFEKQRMKMLKNTGITYYFLFSIEVNSLKYTEYKVK